MLIPSGLHSDPLVSETLEKACDGKTLESGKLAEKFDGDRKCARCVKWLESDGGKNDLEAARQDQWDDENGPGLASIMGDFTLITLDGVQEVTADGSGEESAPVVRELTPADVKGAVAKSKRGAAVARERKRLADQTEARENSAPEIIASTGKTLAAMQEETATFYANGGAVSPEIAALPAPGTVSLASGTVSGGALPVLPCEFRGGVDVINLERTHGKCPECTTYIPLLPDADAREIAPKVSKIKCENSGAAPASGTLVLRDDHTVSVADDYNGKTSAKCPECARFVAITRDRNFHRHNGVTAPVVGEESPDRIGTHNVGGVATPAHKGLTSRMIDTVEHGSIPGDTATADKRRTDESRCKRGNKILKDASGGTVECPECARSVELLKIARPGKEVSWKIPHHVRPGESVRHVGRGEVRDVTPRGEGADVGATVSKGARLALSRGHGSVDGSATTGSQNMAPVQPKGWVGTAGTGSLPAMVRPGIDPEVTGRECVICGELPAVAHAGKSKGWRRRHSSKVGAVLRDRQEKRDATRAAKIESGEILPAPVRREARKAASVGSFSEGNVNGTVTHTPRPEFEPKGTRKPAPNGNKHTRRSGRAE